MTKSSNESPKDSNEQHGEKKKRQNGRNSFEDYVNAAVNHITNTDLNKGDKERARNNFSNLLYSIKKEV